LTDDVGVQVKELELRQCSLVLVYLISTSRKAWTIAHQTDSAWL